MAFRILVVGDFSGRAEHAGSGVAIHPVEADTLDSVLAAVAPSVEISGAEFVFRELDDFHPDRLYPQLGAAGEEEPDEPAASVERTEPEVYAGASLLDSIVAQQSDEPAAVRHADDLSGFIKRVTAGHVVRAEPEIEDTAAIERMREVLHHERFQEIEGLWRGLDFLLRHCGDAQVSIVDLTLASFLRQEHALRQKLQKHAGWKLVVGDFYFGQDHTAAAVLDRFGSFASAPGATFIAGAQPPSGAGSESWIDLRRSALAPHVGLVIPRFLLRLPYGRETSPVESFKFEEMPVPEHSQYLWGNGAFAAASLIANAYDDEDPDWAKRIQRRIDGIPLHVYKEDGESIATPTAEILMSEHDATALLEAGLMPLASLKHQDGILLVQFRSIAEPAAGLACMAAR